MVSQVNLTPTLSKSLEREKHEILLLLRQPQSL